MFARDNAANVKILDFGCGRGDFSIPLGELGYDVYGLDMFEQRICEARLHAPPNVVFEVRDAMDIPPMGQYDVILCAEVIEHLKDPGTFLRSVKCLLKPNGLLLITVPNGYSLLEIVKRFKDGLKGTALGKNLLDFKRTIFPIPVDLLASQHQGDIHEQYFTPGAITKLVGLCGFQVVRWQNAGPLFAILNPLRLMSTQSRIFRKFDRLDSDLGPRAPKWASGGWYLCCASEGAGSK